MTSERQRGQIFVFFALLFPVLMVVGSIVVTIGNWYVHKRHLQTQVDAAALASAPGFVACPSVFDPAAANVAIKASALEYAGDTLRPPSSLDSTLTGTVRNQQVQEPGDVRVVLNSSRYWQQGDPTDGTGLDETMGTNGGSPCAERFLDVKATDDEVMLLWRWLPFYPSPKAKAKVEIRQILAQAGMLPWAVPEVDPARVVALFVNEATGAIFDHQVLIRNTNFDNDGNPATPFPFSAWVTPVGQEDVVINQPDVGVVILVSKNDPNPTVTTALGTTCNPPGGSGLIKCYGGTTATSGLTFIHGYDSGTAGSVASPQIRDVRVVSPTGCDAQDLSAPYFTLVGNCTAQVKAVIDFGVSGDPRPLGKACAEVNGYTWSSEGGPLGTWTRSINLNAGSGRNVVNISWSSGNREQGNSGNCHNSQPNSGTFSKVAAPYVGNAASGPVKYLDLLATDAGGGAVHANSVERSGTAYKYWVAVGLPQPLELRPPLSPPILLRMASPSGSQNQAIDCDRSRRFDEEIITGCLTEYRVNYWDQNGDGVKEWENILCAGYSTTNLPPRPGDPTPNCILTETGDMTGQLRTGVQARFTPCIDAPNRWPKTAQGQRDFILGLARGTISDKRFVTLIITDITAFTGSGNEPVPVKYFAGFYVTGWDYHPQQSPGCADNDPHPIYGTGYQHTRDDGDVWGHFVNIVNFSGSGDPSEFLCNFDQVGNCIAVLVE
jgi:hypothetical protein